ncbi:MAG: ZIP family metal transporter [Ruminococcus sp.]|nr:ZIP family metal transporter [Ruminococcus sp.]
MDSIMFAAAATGFTFLLTALGAAVVFFVKKAGETDRLKRAFLGFAAGVMTAAAVWSLLLPAIEQAEKTSGAAWVPAALGVMAGVGFLMLFDKLMPFFHPAEPETIRSGFKRVSLLVFAITLHNIPEGMAVGLACALAEGPQGKAAAAALTLGIGIQNFPEGAAISLPLRQEGMSRGRAFVFGALSGAVEPVFGVLTAVAAAHVTAMMPYLLAFAAGAMLYVVVEELIPEAHLGAGHIGTLGVMGGFIVMMVLDVAI